jgi:mono/diheme cytochrome c family protein
MIYLFSQRKWKTPFNNNRNLSFGGTMKKIVLTVMAAGIGFTVTALAAQQPSASEGAQLLEQRCSVCHSSSKAKHAKKTVGEWEKTVARMMNKGATLSEKEKKILVDYLAATYKP